MAKYIKLGGYGGRYKTIVDDEDFVWLSLCKWRINKDGYVIRQQTVGSRRKTIRMHRLIAGTPPGMHTDHQNGIRLDNRRKNLRHLTPSENAKWKPAVARHGIRRKLGPAVSGNYIGVFYNKNYRRKWQAYIWLGGRGGKQHIIGRFDSEHEAALAYNEAALKYFGSTSILNEVASIAV